MIFSRKPKVKTEPRAQTTYTPPEYGEFTAPKLNVPRFEEKRIEHKERFIALQYSMQILPSNSII